MRDYEKYRGKCKELSEELCEQNPNLRLVRGHYDCPYWGQQEHWWCEDSEGNIHDPTKLQFPSKGLGEYIEFDGMCVCENCGKEVEEEKVIIQGKFPCCSNFCAFDLVGMAEYYKP